MKLIVYNFDGTVFADEAERTIEDCFNSIVQFEHEHNNDKVEIVRVERMVFVNGKMLSFIAGI